MDKEYPDTIREFFQELSDEKSCLEYLFKLRWPTGYTCPKCDSSSDPWRASRNRLKCRSCRHEAPITADTIFEKTRSPLSTWLEAAWHVATAKNGISAKTLERILGTSYHVAHMMLQRFRVAMANSEKIKLTGTVQIDEVLIDSGRCIRKLDDDTEKNLVVIAVEIKEDKSLGRTRMLCIPDASESSLIPFVYGSVSSNATLLTDGWNGYDKIESFAYGYTREIMDMSDSDDFTYSRMPDVHILSNLLKRWILGTYQGSISGIYLQAYLDEYTFRFNNDVSENQGLVFKRLVEYSLLTKLKTKADIVDF